MSSTSERIAIARGSMYSHTVALVIVLSRNKYYSSESVDLSPFYPRGVRVIEILIVQLLSQIYDYLRGRKEIGLQAHWK
jgi:hypothetical protein